jgi:hypothetical protein
MIYSWSVWYYSPVMSNLENSYKKTEATEDRKSYPGLRRAILDAQLGDAIQRATEPDEGAE